MHSFIVKRRPNSYNSNVGRKKIVYSGVVQAAFQSVYPSHDPLTEDLYAMVYYFYKKDLNLDADNISKPIWDGLSSVVFVDDRQVKLRIAGAFDLTKTDFTVIDMTGLAGNIVIDLLEAFENEDHILYIECGSFDSSLIRFNLVKNGN